MSYSIRYGSNKREPAPTLPPRSVRYLGIAFLAAAFLTVTLWPQGRDLAQQLLCPWLTTQTQEAFADLVTQIRDGIPVVQALADFCGILLKNGLIPV